MEPNEYPHVFCESNWAGCPVIVFGLAILALGLYGAENARLNEGTAVILLLFGGLVIWQGRKIAIRKQPLFQFGPTGLWTPKLGFMPWKKIQVSIEAVSGFGVGAIKSLSIMQRKPNKTLDTVALASLGTAEDEIVRLLKKYTDIEPPRW